MPARIATALALLFVFVAGAPRAEETTDGFREVRTITECHALPEDTERVMIRWFPEGIGKAIAELARLPKLKEIDFRRSQVVDADLEGLANCKLIERVTFQGGGYTANRIGDDGFVHLGRCTTLREINLSSTYVSEKAMESLSRLPNLRTLSGVQMDGAALRHVPRLKQLVDLHASLKNFTEEDLKQLSALKALQTLRLSTNFLLPSQALRFLDHLTELEYLQLRSAADADFLSRMEPLKKLRVLHLPDRLEWRTGIGLVLVAQHPLLEDLEFGIEELDGRAMMALGSLSNLKRLRVVCNHSPSDESIRELARLKRLEILNINNLEAIGDAGFAALCELKSLKALSLSQMPKVTSEGFAKIGNLKSLEILWLGDVSRGPLELAALGNLTRLRELSIQSSISEKVITAWKDLSALEILHLYGPGLKKNCVKQFSQFPAIRELSLDAAKLGNSDLKYFYSLFNLRQLELRRKSFDKDDLQKLANALPQCAVYAEKRILPNGDASK